MRIPEDQTRASIVRQSGNPNLRELSQFHNRTVIEALFETLIKNGSDKVVKLVTGRKEGNEPYRLFLFSLCADGARLSGVRLEILTFGYRLFKKPFRSCEYRTERFLPRIDNL